MSHPGTAPWRLPDLWPYWVELKRPGQCDFCQAHYFTDPLSKVRHLLENRNRVYFGSIINLGAGWDPKLSAGCPHICFWQVSPVTALWHMPAPLLPPTPMFAAPGSLGDWPTSDILGIPICAAIWPIQ